MNEHREIGFENFDQWVNSRKWVSWWIGLNDPTPTSAPSKKSCYGISWMGWKCPLRVSLLNQFIFSFYFFLWLYFFFPILVFSFYLFIYLLLLLLLFGINVFWPTLDPNFLLRSSYLLQPTYRLSTTLLPINHLPSSSC